MLKKQNGKTTERFFVETLGYLLRRKDIKVKTPERMKTISSSRKIELSFLFFVLGFFFSGSNVYSYNQGDNLEIPEPIRVPAIVVGADTFAYISLPWVIIEDKMPFETRRQYEKWTRLKQNVKKVYPYAILASAKLKEMEIALDHIPGEAAKKAYSKKVEKELQEQFGEELKSLSINQGRILIKLIDRETGETSYELVKELRGSFSAFMWQSLARIFGSNLKSDYDPNGEDKLIEAAIKQIEAGQF